MKWQDRLDLFEACRRGDLESVKRFLQQSVECRLRMQVRTPSEPPGSNVADELISQTTETSDTITSVTNDLDIKSQSVPHPTSPISQAEWQIPNNIDSEPAQGWTCLHAACGPGSGPRCAIVVLLLNAGADIDVRFQN